MIYVRNGIVNLMIKLMVIFNVFNLNQKQQDSNRYWFVKTNISV